MIQDFPTTKAALRKQIRTKLSRLSPGQRQAATSAICALLPAHQVWQEAKSILFYAPLPDEVDIWPLLQTAVSKGKIVLLPRFVPNRNSYEVCPIARLDQTLLAGKFGIREPDHQSACFPLNQLDLVLVPGVAFSLNGHRIGRGKGFYDRLLAQYSGVKCGIAFDEQIEADLPVESHDVVMNCIRTPTRWLEVSQTRP